MTAAFADNELKYLTAWAIEDHLGRASGCARVLQREHDVSPVVLGQLFAWWSRESRVDQMALVDGPYPEGPIEWPWPTKHTFETRLRELLPESSIHYLQELGALPGEKVPS
jgi:hypothetical protein